MRRPLRTLAAAVAAAFVLALLPMTAASAAVVTMNGALVTGGATFNRPANCSTLSNVGTTVYDASAVFTVDVDGLYVIDMVSTNLTGDNDAVLVLYQGAFNPSAPLTNCIAYDDDSGTAPFSPRVVRSLTAGVQYTLVTTTFTNGITGTFTNSFDGPGTVVFGATVPAVTVNQGPGQPDPTSMPSAAFDVVFASSVTGLAESDFIVGGTAGATAVALSGSGASYVATVTGATAAGTITLDLPAGAAISGAGFFNPASTSTDNTVEYAPVPPLIPTVTVNQESGQADPTSNPSAEFDVLFSTAVTGLAASDFVIGGTAGATGVTLSGSGTSYVATVTGATTAGTIVLSLPAGAAMSADGSFSTASTSTDNTVEFVPAPLTVAVTPASGQTEPSTSPSLAFDIVFSEPVDGFDPSDLVISGTAPGVTTVLTGTGPAYVVTVTVTGSGTVVVSVPAGVVTSAAWGLPNLVSVPGQVTATYQAPSGPAQPEPAEPEPTVPAPAVPGPSLAVTGGSHIPIGLPIGLIVIGGILAIATVTRARLVIDRSR